MDLEKYPIVLHADDDPEDRQLVQEMFERYMPMQLLSFDDGFPLFESLEHLVSDNKIPSLVILDINMRHSNGKEILRTIRSKKKFDAINVVLLTSSFSENDELFATQRKAACFTKPLNIEQMNIIAEKFLSIIGDHYH